MCKLCAEEDSRRFPRWMRIWGSTVCERKLLCWWRLDFSADRRRLHSSCTKNTTAVSEGCTEIAQVYIKFEESDTDNSSDCLPMERALGVEWCAEVDTFRFQINLGNKGTTRRGILSTVCSIFDPLGLIAPVTLVGKQILQELCRQGLDWDDPIPEPLEMKYQQWVSDLTHLGEITINRCYKPKDFGPVVTAELHNFSDASLVGYGQCSYLRLLNAKGKVQCSLVLGKARVTPLKAVTIPRLELTAAVLSTRIATLLANELQFDNLKQFYWTDSKVVLSYIQNEEKRFHVYVANRISEIRERSEVDQWNHVPTDLNPADSASRGLTTCELKQSTWLTGPEFLWEPQISYPSNETATLKLGEDDPEVKQARSLATQCSFPENPVLDYLRNLSSWTKMCRLVAYLKKLGKKTTGSPFTADDAMQSKKINMSVTDYQEAARLLSGSFNAKVLEQSCISWNEVIDWRAVAHFASLIHSWMMDSSELEAACTMLRSQTKWNTLLCCSRTITFRWPLCHTSTSVWGTKGRIQLSTKFVTMVSG